MTAWRMECIGYDENFQRRVATLYPPWAEQEKERKQEAKKRKQAKPPADDDPDDSDAVSYA